MLNFDLNCCRLIIWVVILIFLQVVRRLRHLLQRFLFPNFVCIDSSGWIKSESQLVWTLHTTCCRPVLAHVLQRPSIACWMEWRTVPFHVFSSVLADVSFTLVVAVTEASTSILLPQPPQLERSCMAEFSVQKYVIIDRVSVKAAAPRCVCSWRF